MPREEIDLLTDDLIRLGDRNYYDLSAAADEGWRSFRSHPQGANCSCPAMEILGHFYKLGYRLTKDPS